MLKFQAFYQRSQIQEWKVLYIDYSLLKQMLRPFQEIIKLESYNSDKVTQSLISYNMYKKRTMPQFTLPEELIHRLKRIEENFIQFYLAEMIKCNQFFVLHIQQVEISMKKLSFNLLILAEKKAKLTQTQREANQVAKNFYILRDSTQGLYREAYLLEQFCHMNRQASLKITKQFEEKAFFMEDTQKNLKRLHIMFNTLEINHQSHSLNQLLDDIETLYINNFSKDNPKKAIQVLKAETKERVFTVKNAFLFGSFLGVSTCLLSMILIHRVEFIKNFNISYDIYFPIFRGLGLFIFYFWLLGCNVYIWEMCHINYKQIFRFNYHHSSVFQILKRISGITVIFLVVFLLSIFKENSDDANDNDYSSPLVKLIFFKPQIGPLIIWSAIIFYFVMPAKKAFNAEGRRYFWRLLWQCLISATIPMTFPISWCTDQFVSFVGPLRDISYTLCFYYHYFFYGTQNQDCGDSKNITSGLVIACFPLILRMIQCIRQGHDQGFQLWVLYYLGKFFKTDNWYNFLKYMASLLTAVLSYVSKFQDPIFYAWIVAATFSMIYSYYWDVKKDWKFFQPDTKYRFLRRQLAYDSPKFYYSIIMMNIILRMCWILSISPGLINLWGPFFVYMISSLEIFRRSLWNLIRVEKEHVVNVGDFRAVPQLRFPYETRLKKETPSQWLEESEIQQNESQIINRSSKAFSGESRERFSTFPTLDANDMYKERQAYLKEQEEQLFVSHRFQDDNEGEQVYRQTYDEFQRRVEKLNSEYPDLVKKCKQESIDIQQYISKLTRTDVDIREGIDQNDKSKISQISVG